MDIVFVLIFAAVMAVAVSGMIERERVLSLPEDEVQR